MILFDSRSLDGALFFLYFSHFYLTKSKWTPGKLKENRKAYSDKAFIWMLKKLR